MEHRQKPLVRVAEIEIHADSIEAYQSFLAEEIEASVYLEPGVISLQAVAHRDDPTRIIIMETYRDQAAYEAHLQTAHFLKYKNGTAQMVKALRLIETDAICLRSKNG